MIKNKTQNWWRNGIECNKSWKYKTSKWIDWPSLTEQTWINTRATYHGKLTMLYSIKWGATSHYGRMSSPIAKDNLLENKAWKCCSICQFVACCLVSVFHFLNIILMLFLLIMKKHKHLHSVPFLTIGSLKLYCVFFPSMLLGADEYWKPKHLV